MSLPNPEDLKKFTQRLEQKRREEIETGEVPEVCQRKTEQEREAYQAEMRKAIKENRNTQRALKTVQKLAKKASRQNATNSTKPKKMGKNRKRGSR